MKYKATADSELAESAGVFFVDEGEARPLGVPTESEFAESCGKFTVQIGEARLPKKESNIHRGSGGGHAFPQFHEDIVDRRRPQYHEDMAEAIQLAPRLHSAERIGFLRKSARLSPKRAGGIRI